MLTGFCKRFSLNNLKTDKPRGQIATLLILIIVVILVMILTTVNLGVISIEATRLSNAADSASLYLASQLATKANTLWNHLGQSFGFCKKGWGFLGSLFSILDPFSMAFVGSALGVYDNPWQGMIKGVENGVKIGGAILAGLAMPGGPYTAAIMGVIAAAGIIYQDSVAMQMTAEGMKDISAQLSGLPELDRIRESVFLQALSQTVDDPNKAPDTYDSDGDGDTQKVVPYFQYWFDRRTAELENIVPQLKLYTEAFVNGPLTDFRDFAETQYTNGPFSRQGVDDVSVDGIVVEVAKALKEAGDIFAVSFWKPGIPPADADNYYDAIDALSGNLMGFVSAIEELKKQDIDQLTSSYQFWIQQFYDPETKWTEGLTEEAAGEVNADWSDVLENSIEPKLKAWKEEIEAKRKQLPQCTYKTSDGGGCGEDWSWQGWQQYLQKQEWYGEYVEWSEKWNYQEAVDLQGWLQDLQKQEWYGGWLGLWQEYLNKGPGDGNRVANPPCQDNQFGTIDICLDDEFSLAISKIDVLIYAMQSFSGACKKFYEDMQAAYDEMDTDYGGINPATYKWKDSRGEHSVIIEVGKFKMPRLETQESSGFLTKKVCIRLVDYSDDGSRAWVKIIRQDPSKNVRSGGVSLGMWNPFYSGKITKLSRAFYNYNEVGLAGKE